MSIYIGMRIIRVQPQIRRGEKQYKYDVLVITNYDNINILLLRCVYTTQTDFISVVNPAGQREHFPLFQSPKFPFVYTAFRKLYSQFLYF